MASATFTRQVGNLPVEVTSFVDRRHEMAEVRRLLSVSRLVTLTGVGGVGKTRLALRAATDHHRAFDALWFVDLSGLHDPALVTQTVAATVGLRDLSNRHPLTALGEFLTTRSVLLVLDNCEHLLDACAVLTDGLLRAAPDLRILATSRQSLGISGESTLSVPPLSIPEADHPLTVQGVEQYASVGLFTDRAAAVLSGFKLDEHNHEAVAMLCRQLEGIPLAIELAAVRLRALSVNDIVARLDDRHRWLTSGRRVGSPRQQSLYDLIDWSFQLLSPHEQALWSRMSIFVGHFGLAAAEAVCADDDIPSESVFDLLDALVDKSLVLREEYDGQVRYRLLETIRQFGLGRLGDAEGRRLARRHRDWYGWLIDQAAQAWFGPEQVSWFRRLRLAQPNIRAALAFCLREPGEAEIGLGMATALHQPYWLANSFFNEGRHWLDLLLRAAPEGTVAQARGLYVKAWLALIQGDNATALPTLDQSRVLAERTNDPQSLAYVRHIGGLATVFAGDMPEAARLLGEAHARHTADGDLFGIAMSALPLALALYKEGEVDRASALLKECLALTESHGESWCRSWALTVLAIEMWRRGQNRRATSLAREGLLLNRALDDRHNMTLGIQALAWIAADTGEHEYAARMLGAAESLAHTVDIEVLHFAIHVKYHTRAKKLLQETMGEEGFNRAFDIGRRLTLEQTIAEALGEGPAEPRQPPTPDQAADGTASPLTRRETEIAGLIAQGLTNKGIAAELVISQRTAEGHVEHILAKLAFTSRAQIAAWAAGQKDNAGLG